MHGYSRIPDLGFIWDFSAVVVELVLVAGGFAAIKYIIKNKSGMEDKEMIQRLWSRPFEVQGQRIEQPLLFAICTSLGAKNLVKLLGDVALALATVQWTPFFVFFAILAKGVITVVALGFSAWVSAVVYRMNGGTKGKSCAAGTLGIHWLIIYLSTGPLFTDKKEELKVSIVKIILVAWSAAAAVLFVQLPFYVLGGYKKLPVAQEPGEEPAKSSWFPERALVIPLAVVCGVAEWFSNSVGRETGFFSMFMSRETYFSRVVGAASQLTALVACGVASVVMVNSSLRRGDNQWQWRAFSTPAIANFLCVITEAIFKKPIASELFLADMIPRVMRGGLCGVLGGYAYLRAATAFYQSTTSQLKKKQ